MDTEPLKHRTPGKPLATWVRDAHGKHALRCEAFMQQLEEDLHNQTEVRMPEYPTDGPRTGRAWEFLWHWGDECQPEEPSWSDQDLTSRQVWERAWSRWWPTVPRKFVAKQLFDGRYAVGVLAWLARRFQLNVSVASWPTTDPEQLEYYGLVDDELREWGETTEVHPLARTLLNGTSPPPTLLVGGGHAARYPMYALRSPIPCRIAGATPRSEVPAKAWTHVLKWRQHLDRANPWLFAKSRRVNVAASLFGGLNSIEAHQERRIDVIIDLLALKRRPAHAVAGPQHASRVALRALVQREWNVNAQQTAWPLLVQHAVHGDSCLAMRCDDRELLDVFCATNNGETRRITALRFPSEHPVPLTIQEEPERRNRRGMDDDQLAEKPTGNHLTPWPVTFVGGDLVVLFDVGMPKNSFAGS